MASLLLERFDPLSKAASKAVHPRVGTRVWDDILKDGGQTLLLGLRKWYLFELPKGLGSRGSARDCNVQM